MLVDINPNLELPDYKLKLCKLNTEPVSSLKNITDFQLDAYFANIDEISFNIPLYRVGDNGESVKNEIYDLVYGDMLILLNKTKYFYIDRADEKVSSSGEAYKSVHAFSREFEMSQKKVIGYSAVSRRLWDINNPIDDDGLEIGIMNYIEKRTGWKTGYISHNLTTIYRSFDFSNSNILQMMIEIQKSFGCLFRFNTIDKIIDIYEVTQLGKNQGLYISDRNYINSLDKKVNYGEIKTRLFLYGKDNVSIQSVNITGQPYLENYDYYKTTDFMSQDLILALDNYDAFIETKRGDFAGYLEQLAIRNEALGLRSDELVALKSQLKDIQLNLDIAITSKQPTEQYKTQETAKLLEIKNKTTQITNLENQILSIYTSMETLKNDIDISEHLTLVQLRELDSFIKEDVFNDTNYTEDNVDELYNEGVKLLSKVSQPAIQFNTDVVDFLSVVECQHVWDKFILGDLVKIRHSELGVNMEVRLVGYKHNPDSNSLSLIFSNRDSVDNADVYLRDLLNSMNVTSTTVDFNKLKWDKGQDAQSMIIQYIDNALDLSKQEILKATGQKPMMDERGIWIVKENPDGSIDPKQMRIINNVLAITNDNWNTVSTAVDGSGVNAETVRGKLGQFAQVQAHQIVVGDFGQKISNEVLDIDIDLDGVVQQEELYNQVVISQKKGLQVLDKANRERVRLGNYKPGKYGLSIKDKSGSTTVLDEDGILQTWQEGRTDNVDTNKPLNLYVYVPEQTNIIHKAILRFKLEKFRAYSTSTISGGGFAESTADGGSFVESTLSGGGTTTDTGASGINVEWITAQTDTVDGHRHSFERVHAHQHAVTIQAHQHYMNIPAHKHGVVIPVHKHDIEYGIYESEYPTDVTIKINGMDYTSYLGGRNGVFNGDRDDIDITSLLEIGKWNTISLGSATLGRLESTVFIQAFINTSKKSIILDDRYVGSGLLNSTVGVGEVAITAKRTHIDSGIEQLFRINVVRGVASVHSMDWASQELGWKDEFVVGNATSVAISMNGEWVHNEVENKYGFKTGNYPHLFWVDNGNLYTQYWNDVSTKRQLSSGVVKVSAIRGWKNVSFIERDQGVIVGYIKTDGKVYYMNYCMQSSGLFAWENEQEILEFTGTAKDINMSITNDYRVGFNIEDNAGQIHWILSEKNWGGMAVSPHTLSVAPVQVIGNLIPLEYYDGIHTETITVAPTEISGQLLYAVKDNEILSIKNVPTTKLNIDNVEYEDWGWAIEFEVRNPIPNLTLQQVVFTSIESGIPVGMTSIEAIGENKYKVVVDNIVEVGMNNIFGDIRVTITGALNPAEIAYDTIIKDFTPINLVPEFIPLPIVDLIWNE